MSRECLRTQHRRGGW